MLPTWNEESGSSFGVTHFGDCEPAAGAHRSRLAAVGRRCFTRSRQYRVNLDTGWRAAETLDSALSKTVGWYLANEAWWRPLDAARSAGDVYGLLRTA